MLGHWGRLMCVAVTRAAHLVPQGGDLAFPVAKGAQQRGVRLTAPAAGVRVLSGSPTLAGQPQGLRLMRPTHLGSASEDTQRRSSVQLMRRASKWEVIRGQVRT